MATEDQIDAATLTTSQYAVEGCVLIKESFHEGLVFGESDSPEDGDSPI